MTNEVWGQGYHHRKHMVVEHFFQQGVPIEETYMPHLWCTHSFLVLLTACLSPLIPMPAPVNFLPLTNFRSMSHYWWHVIFAQFLSSDLKWVKKSWAAHFFCMTNDDDYPMQKKNNDNDNKWLFQQSPGQCMDWLIDRIFRLQQSALVIKVQQKVFDPGFDWAHGHYLSSMIQDKNSNHSCDSTTIPQFQYKESESTYF